MKKILLCAVSAVLLLSGCSHKYIDDPYTKYGGYWECIKVVTDEGVYDEYYLDPKIPVSAVYNLAIAEDGTGYLDSPISVLYGENGKQALKWEAEDSTLKLYGESSSDVLSLEYTEDERLLLRSDEKTEIWFGKVDRLTAFDPGVLNDKAKGEDK